MFMKHRRATIIRWLIFNTLDILFPPLPSQNGSFFVDVFDMHVGLNASFFNNINLFFRMFSHLQLH